MGWMYNMGHGVTQDYVQAYAWYNLAAANGDALRKDVQPVKDVLTKLMTPEQIARAQRLSKELHKNINAAK
jgi:hypothetical protein